MARNDGRIELLFPTAGLVEKFAYQSQPPYSTAEANNVRAYDAAEGRERGGSRPGLRRVYPQTVLAGSPVQLILPVVSTTSTGEIIRQLVIVSSGVIYAASQTGVFGVGAPDILLAEDDAELLTEDSQELLLVWDVLDTGIWPLTGGARAGEVFIADPSVRVVGDDGQIDSTKKLTAPSVSDWTQLGIRQQYDLVAISPIGTSQVVPGVYRIGAIASDGITLQAAGGIGTGACSYEVAAGIKVYDMKTGEATVLTPTAGAAPIGCTAACIYRDRLVVAKSNIWYVSRLGNPRDWDYGADPSDPTRAIAGTASEAGVLGEPIVALAPHTDDYLIIFCDRSVWIMRGDPGFGGQIDAISRTAGIVSETAWCWGPDGALWFLSQEGLFVLPPAPNAYPLPVSREVIPRRLLGLSRTTHAVILAYDELDHGIHIIVTPKDGTDGEIWWYDLNGKGFWPASVNTAHQPTAAAIFRSPEQEKDSVVFGCNDGGLRVLDWSMESDDGLPFESKVLFGPVRLGSPASSGIITEIVADMDNQTASVTYEILGAETGEEVVSAQPRATGTWGPGKNPVSHPRVSGYAGGVRLRSTTRWAVEGITVRVLPTGRRR